VQGCHDLRTFADRGRDPLYRFGTDAVAGKGRKHHDQKTNTAALTGTKADEKAYNAALKNLPNKPYGTR
jgi:hypothetical protein